MLLSLQSPQVCCLPCFPDIQRFVQGQKQQGQNQCIAGCSGRVSSMLMHQ